MYPYRSSTDRQKSYTGDPEDSEESLTSLVGVVQAIVSLCAIENDRIRYINAGSLRIAFLLKSPLYLIAVSDWLEPETVVRPYPHLYSSSALQNADIEGFAKASNTLGIPVPPDSERGHTVSITCYIQQTLEFRSQETPRGHRGDYAVST